MLLWGIHGAILKKIASNTFLKIKYGSEASYCFFLSVESCALFGLGAPPVPHR